MLEVLRPDARLLRAQHHHSILYSRIKKEFVSLVLVFLVLVLALVLVHSLSLQFLDFKWMSK